MSASMIAQLVGLGGLLSLAACGYALGVLNGKTPARLKSQGLICLSTFLTFASVFVWLAIVEVISQRDSRTINLLGSFIFVAIMGEILLDARAARKAFEKYEGVRSKVAKEA